MSWTNPANGTITIVGAAAAPTVSIQPASATRYVGAAVTFTASVGGYPTPLLQWKHAGTNIVGATSQTLALSNLQLVDAGSYVLYATNASGFANSSASVLTVLPAPVSSAYVGSVLSHNPMGYWRFNDGGGTNAFDYAGGNDAFDPLGSALQAGPRPPAFLGFESTNTVPFLNGKNQGYASTVSLFNNRSNFTLMGWFNIDASQYPINTDAQHPEGRASLFGQNSVAELGFYQGTNLYFWCSGIGSTISVTSGFAPDAWHFVAVVSDTVAGTTTVYLDGAVAGTASACSGAAGSQLFSIGKNVTAAPSGGNDTAFFPGSIDEVALFDHALAGPQIQSLYFTGAPVILHIAPSGASLQLTWTQGTLQEANAVTGPWTAVSGASSPWLVTPTGNKFYRVQVSP